MRKIQAFQARVDTALALAVAVINFAILLVVWDIVGVQADESLNIYGALRLLSGERIYRDFWMYNPPGIFFLTASLFALLGESLFAIRLVLISVASLTAAVLYILGRKFMGRGWALVAPSLFIAVGVNLWPVAVYHWYSTFILIFSTFFVARFLEDRSRRWSLFVGGFLAGAAFLFQQPKGGLLIVVLFLFLLCESRVRSGGKDWITGLVRTGGIYAAGVAAPTFMAAIYFVLLGTLGDAISAAVVFPARLLTQSGSGSGFLRYYGSMTGDILKQMAGASSWSPMSWVLALVMALVNFGGPLSILLSLAGWSARRLSGLTDNTIPVLCSVAALAAFGSSLQKPDFHHLLTVLPPSFLTLCYVFHAIADKSGFTRAALIRKGAAILGAGTVVACSVMVLDANISFASSLHRVSLNSPLGFVPVLKKGGQQIVAERLPLVNVIDHIQLHTSPEENIFVMSYSPFIYYLSARGNPCVYADLPSSPCGEGAKFHVLKLGQASANRERLDSAVRSLETDKTRLLVMDPASSCQITEGVGEAGYDPLVDYIKRRYRIEAIYGRYVVMVRSD